MVISICVEGIKTVAWGVRKTDVFIHFPAKFSRDTDLKQITRYVNFHAKFNGTLIWCRDHAKSDNVATIFPLNISERLNRCISCDVRSREDGDINFLAKFSGETEFTYRKHEGNFPSTFSGGNCIGS